MTTILDFPSEIYRTHFWQITLVAVRSRTPSSAKARAPGTSAGVEALAALLRPGNAGSNTAADLRDASGGSRRRTPPAFCSDPPKSEVRQRSIKGNQPTR